MSTFLYLLGGLPIVAWAICVVAVIAEGEGKAFAERAALVSLVTVLALALCLALIYAGMNLDGYFVRIVEVER